MPLATGPFVILYIYLISWLYGFYDETSGPIFDNDEVLRLYQIQGIVGLIVVFVMMGIYVNFADKVGVRVMLPITAVLRALSCLSIYFIEDPTQGPWFYILVPTVHGTIALVVVCINGYI
jgi:uncharacterized membrane protein (DUF485 family)